MKILYLISGGDSGGAKTHVLSLLREVNTKEEARLAALGDGVLAREAAETGLPCTVLSGGFLAELFGTRKLLREGGYDILHCHGCRADLIGALLRRGTAARVIATVHSDHRLDYLGRGIRGRLLTALCGFSLRQMDALTCVTDVMRERYEARHYRSERLYTIYNGADFARPLRKTERNAWFAAHGVTLSGEELIIGAAARLEPVKDIETLLRGFARAAEVCPRLRLALAGNGAEEEKLRALSVSLGAAEKIFFLGWVDDMEGFYASIDINALSSLSETLPYALTDGARYALPSVSTAVGGIPRLIENEKTGFLFPPRDADALTGALVRLGEDEALRHRLGAALRERGEREFSLGAMGEKQCSIYRSILRPRRGIVISCACGQGNLGDEAILSALLAQLRKADAEAFISVISRHPRETAARHGVHALGYFDRIGIRRALRGARLFLSGGGNLLQDVTSKRSLAFYLRLLTLAKRLGCRVVLCGAGLGPLSESGRKKTAECLRRNADLLLLREEESRKLAEAMGLADEKCVLTADLALSLPAGEKKEGEAPYLLFCPREWRGARESIERVASALRDYTKQKGLRLYVAALSKNDLPLCRSLPADEVLPAEDIPGFASLVSGAEAVVSMRLHALVFASRAGVKAVGIDCDGRIDAFMRRIGGIALPAFDCVSGLSSALAAAGSGNGEAQLCALREGERLLMKEVRGNHE